MPPMLTDGPSGSLHVVPVLRGGVPHSYLHTVLYLLATMSPSLLLAVDQKARQPVDEFRASILTALVW